MMLFKIIPVLFLLCKLVGAQTQEKVYQEKASQQCTNVGGGSSIASVAECQQAAVKLGWADTTADTITAINYPPGCFFYANGALYFNTHNPSIDCTASEKCACSVLCPPGTYQDEVNQTTCKSCTAGFYQDVAGQSV